MRELKMTSTSLFARKGIGALALGLTGLSLITACNSSESIAPTADNIPKAPSLTKAANGPASHVVWTIMDKVSGDSIGGTWFTYKSLNGTLFNTTDNTYKDLDPRSGVFDVIAEKEGPMAVCLKNWDASTIYVIPQPGGGNCVTAEVSGKLTTLKPWVANLKRSAYWWASVNGLPSYYGTYKVTGPYGWTTTVVGNGQNDLAKNRYVYAQFPFTGMYTVCQIVPPSGTKLPAQPCAAVNMTSEGGILLPIFVNKSL
jgi:hypothetical protein